MNDTVMIPEKRKHFLTGDVTFPLTVGARAVVVTDCGTLNTSAVAAIRFISPATIIFETQNSHYQVTLKTQLGSGFAI